MVLATRVNIRTIVFDWLDKWIGKCMCSVITPFKNRALIFIIQISLNKRPVFAIKPAVYCHVAFKILLHSFSRCNINVIMFFFSSSRSGPKFSNDYNSFHYHDCWSGEGKLFLYNQKTVSFIFLSVEKMVSYDPLGSSWRNVGNWIISFHINE